MKAKCSCGQEYDVEESMVGQVAECELCGSEFTIEAPDGEKEIFRRKPSIKGETRKIVFAVFFFLVGMSGFAFPPLFAISLIGIALALKAWYNTSSREFILTNERLFVHRGLLAKSIEELELFRIKDVKMSQKFLERLFGFGNIIILSTDDSTPNTVLNGVKNPNELKEIIRKHYRDARKREGVKSMEYIQS